MVTRTIILLLLLLLLLFQNITLAQKYCGYNNKRSSLEQQIRTEDGGMFLNALPISKNSLQIEGNGYIGISSFKSDALIFAARSQIRYGLFKGIELNIKGLEHKLSGTEAEIPYTKMVSFGYKQKIFRKIKINGIYLGSYSIKYLIVNSKSDNQTNKGASVHSLLTIIKYPWRTDYALGLTYIYNESLLLPSFSLKGVYKRESSKLGFVIGTSFDSFGLICSIGLQYSDSKYIISPSFTTDIAQIYTTDLEGGVKLFNLSYTYRF